MDYSNVFIFKIDFLCDVKLYQIYLRSIFYIDKIDPKLWLILK